MFLACFVIGACILAGILFWFQVRENKQLREHLDMWMEVSRPGRMIFITDNENDTCLTEWMQIYIRKHEEAPYVEEVSRSAKDGILTIEWNTGEVLMGLNGSVKELPYLPHIEMYDNHFFFDDSVAPERVKALLNSEQLRNYVIKVGFVDKKGI